MVLHRMVLMHKELKFLVQVFQPQQRANALVERVFVDDQNDIPLNVGWRATP
jgi:Holliday junction resolvasome RuvABC endonuclease subunit